MEPVLYGLQSAQTAQQNMAVVVENIKRIDAESTRLGRKEKAHIAEKANVLLSAFSKTHIAELLLGICPDDECNGLFRDLLGEMLESDTATNLYVKCIRQIELLRNLGAAVFPDANHASALIALLNACDTERMTSHKASFPSERIAYFKNMYADAAFNLFSDVSVHAQAQYFSDFQSVCEAVYYGQVSACILPAENTRNGFFTSFYKLLGKYDLKIVMCCDVEGADEGEINRFYLLKRDFDCIGAMETEAFLDLKVCVSERGSLIEILDSAALCGAEIRRIDSLGFGMSKQMEYHLSFFADMSQFLPFLLYLSVYVPDYNVMGIYTYLNQESENDYFRN